MLHFSDSRGKDLGFSPDELNNVNLQEYHRVPGKLKRLFKAYPHFDYTIPRHNQEINSKNPLFGIIIIIY